MQKKDFLLLTARTADALQLIAAEHTPDKPWFGLPLFLLATLARWLAARV